MRWARRLGVGLVVVLGIFVLGTMLTARSGNPSLWPPPAGSRTVQIYLVNNGYHAGIALPHPALAELAGARGYAALVAVTQRFSSYPWLEFGWGDREFYRAVPTIAHLTIPLALRALFAPGNSSVLHVVGLGPDPVRIFSSAELVAIEISKRGFEELVLRLNQAFVAPDAGVLADLGPGLYGPSLFYPANGTFSILKVCNHWIADLLDAAGLPTTPVLATVPAGLMLDLRWRAGLRPVSHARRHVNRPRPIRWLMRAVLRPPYRDEEGRKGWFERISRAQPHRTRRLELIIPGWPKTSRPLRIAFLSDFHAGSHAGDAARLAAIVSEAQAFRPDLALFGGDFVNMQLVGGGRLPPHVIAATLAHLDAPLGRFAVLGNHDYTYGADQVAAALRHHGITVLNDEQRTLRHEGHEIALAGLPDARELRPSGRALLTQLERPTIVLAHDPFWFAHVPAGPHLTLAGHTHGGQVRLPWIGAFTNASRAPLRWSLGHVVEGGRQLYVTSGIGTSGIPLRIGTPPEFAVIDVTTA